MEMPSMKTEFLEEKLQKIADKYLQDNKESLHISALAITVSPSRDKYMSVYSGYSEYENTSNPVTSNNLFQIGSITKSFTTVILLQLEAQGKLNINDPVSKYFPEYSKWSNVTISQLLNMTSGIYPYVESSEFLNSLAGDIQTSFTPEELINISYSNQTLPLTKGWNYANTGYMLAAMISEKITQKPFEEQMHNLIKQVGLTNTYYHQSVSPMPLINRLVSGYFYNLDPEEFNKLIPGKSDPTCSLGSHTTDQKCVNLSWAGPAGGIVSDTIDINKWVRELYTIRHEVNGKTYGILNKPQFEELTKKSLVSIKEGLPITSPTLTNSGFGLGVGVADDEIYGNKLVL